MTNQQIVILATFLAAPFVGSFLGVLVVRLPARRPVIWARSECDACGNALQVRDLLPLTSWVGLRGRCRYCGARIPALYPILELAAAGIVTWAAFTTPASSLFPTVILGWLLMSLALTDWYTRTLPNPLTFGLATAGLLSSGWHTQELPTDQIIGGMSGVLFFAAIAFAYRTVRRRDGLGWGDVKLIGAIGAWVGWQGLPSVVLYASGVGLAYAAWRQIRDQTSPSDLRLPFGTFLAIAAWVVWLYGPVTILVNSTISRL